MVGRAYDIPAVALRFFNTYGPYQALSNPYTGVLSNFASRVLNGKAPLDFRRRSAEARFRQRLRRCARLPPRTGDAGRGGAGAEHLERRPDDCGGSCRAYHSGDRPARIEPEITGKYRVGDIRHCFADVSLARRGARLGACE